MRAKRRAYDAWYAQRIPVLIALSDPGWTEIGLLGFSCVCLLATGIVWRYKERGLQRRVEQLRKQIAEDFHDELGTKLTIISMYSELIRREVPDDHPLAQHYLQKIAKASNGLYLAMKDLLWALDPARDRLDDLLVKIRDFGEELFEDTATEFSMPGLRPDSNGALLSLEYKRHLLLLLKEGLNNALRHAEATQVTLSAEVKRERLEILLSDNGKGFDAASLHSGEGLKNMRSRARKIGAALRIDSSKEGTTLSISCPLQ